MNLRPCVYSVLVAAAALVGCQEQRMIQRMKEAHIRKHTEQCLHEHRIHVWLLQRAAPELKEKVQRAVRAQWEWSVECCGSDGVKLPNPVKLGQREFKELVELIGLIQSMPALPKSYFMTEPPPFRMPADGQSSEMGVVEPFGGCCGGVSFSLVFYDAEGEYVASWNNCLVVPASRVGEWSKSDEYRPKLMMPDEAYNRLINLPSSIKAEKLDRALRKKIDHEH